MYSMLNWMHAGITESRNGFELTATDRPTIYHRTRLFPLQPVCVDSLQISTFCIQYLRARGIVTYVHASVDAVRFESS